MKDYIRYTLCRFGEYLHSNMDRFESKCLFILVTALIDLHSNMDRFESEEGYTIAVRRWVFTFQYG